MARQYNSYTDYLSLMSPPPLQLCFFFMAVLLFLGFSWYINYESMFEDLMDQMKLALIIFPVLLILAVHLLSSSDNNGRFSSFIPLPEQDSIHRAGGSPWGVGLLLVLLFFMISYHSSIRETWWPLLG